MKYIIYGLGRHFWNNLEFLSDVLKDTIALCDTDKVKHESAAPLGLPLITPQQIPSVISSMRANDGCLVYVSTTDYYNEIFDVLTQKLNIPREHVAPLPVPLISPKLVKLKRNYYTQLYRGPDEPIEATAIESAILLPDRADALEYMPKNGVVAEVGVACGDFSQKILDRLSPKKFYAIDQFSQYISEFAYLSPKLLTVNNMPHKQWYENRFQEDILCGTMELRQGMSWRCISEFPDDYFDYVYLDAEHHYHSVKRDIETLKNKMKNGGFIQFNDYFLGHPFAPPCGVINAVNSFVNSGKHKVKYFCLSLDPLYIGNPDIVVQIHKRSSTDSKPIA